MWNDPVSATIVHRFTCSFCPLFTQSDAIHYTNGETLPWPIMPAGWLCIIVGASRYTVCPNHKLNIAMAVEKHQRPDQDQPYREQWHWRKGKWISVQIERKITEFST